MFPVLVAFCIKEKNQGSGEGLGGFGMYIVVAVGCLACARTN